MYAHLTDGLDLEQREQFDKVLTEGSERKDTKVQARAEREAVMAAMRFAR